MENENILTGYVRRSHQNTCLKLSLNTDALAGCRTYVTSDGKSYIPLVINLNSLEQVLNGERAVTTIIQQPE